MIDKLPERKWLRTRYDKTGTQLWYSVPRNEYDSRNEKKNRREEFENELLNFLMNR